MSGYYPTPRDRARRATNNLGMAWGYAEERRVTDVILAEIEGAVRDALDRERAAVRREEARRT